MYTNIYIYIHMYAYLVQRVQRLTLRNSQHGAHCLRKRVLSRIKRKFCFCSQPLEVCPRGWRPMSLHWQEARPRETAGLRPPHRTLYLPFEPQPRSACPSHGHWTTYGHSKRPHRVHATHHCDDVKNSHAAWALLATLQLVPAKKTVRMHFSPINHWSLGTTYLGS